MADQKLSELAAVTAASSSDLVYVVTGGQSKKMTVGNLASSLQVISAAQAGIIRLVISSTVVSAGTSNTTAWFSFDATKYWAVKLSFGARDIDTVIEDNHYLGIYWVSANNDGTVDGSDIVAHQTGVNEINISEPEKIGNNVNVYFNRQSSTTARIKVSYEADLYLR
jgi:hypothetical protein